MSVIAIADLRFTWPKRSVPVLDIEAFEVSAGEHLFVMGPSGSGKSTLLSLLAGIIVPQEGAVQILGRRVDRCSGPERDRFRADNIGYIFQMFNLIPYLSVVENVVLPCRFSPARRRRASDRSGSAGAEALRLLAHLGLAGADAIDQPVGELSVGQQQRVAAARALIGDPPLLIADEPTSSLDADRRAAFIELLFQQCTQSRTTVVFVSHDPGLATHFARTIRLDDLNRAGDPAAVRAGDGR